MKKTYLLLLCWLLCQLAGAQQSNENYILTRTMLDASGSKYLESVLTNTASGELACKRYQVSSSGALTENDCYSAGQLYVLKSTDEDGRVSYQFTDILGQQLLSRCISSGVSRDHFPEATVNATGYQTGSLVRILGSDKILAKAIYYDIKGRAVREVAQNDMGGYDVRTTEYTFTGKPLTAHHSQTEYKDRGVVANFAHNFNEKYTYTYDHAERLTKVVHQMDNNAPVTLAENHYDELGRLTEKRLHGNDQLTINYAYNLRGWPESINSSLFNERLYYTKGGGKPQYGGNISSMYWWSNDSQGFHKYSFSYDGLNRLTSANYAYSMSMIGVKSQYSVSYTYDKMGNITNLLRHGLAAQPSMYRPIDDLDLWYNGNQLRKVTDHVTATNPLYNSAFNYVDGSSEEQEFFYDGNGNMTKDLDKGISIEYNTLGLASKVQTDGMDVLYKYAADGTKLQTSYSYPATIVQPYDSLFADSVLHARPGGPLIADSLIRKSQVVLPASSAPLLSQAVTPTKATGISKSYYYVQNAIRSNFGLLNDNLRTVFTEEGYITFSGKTPVYHYYLRDHQGNNRVVVNQDGTVEQITHYYPYGGWFGESTNPTHQNFKYGGKELDLTAGLNSYDFSARTQRPDLGIFPTLDPLAENHYDFSPYAYCGNNPVNRIDPSGMDWYEFSEDGKYQGKVETEGQHRILIHSKKQTKTGEEYDSYRFIDFADPIHDSDDIDKGIIDNLIFVGDEEIQAMLEEQGAFESGIFEFAKESQGGGKFDYSFAKLPSKYSKSGFDGKNSNSLFLPEGDYMAHNFMNFGNYLWGATGYVVGFNYAALQSGAHLNSLLNSKRNGYSSQLDSKDDQRSIIKGIYHAQVWNYRKLKK